MGRQGRENMTESDMSKYEKKIEVRNIQLEDIDEIMKLWSRCFSGMEPWKREQLESHLHIFPEGQFCVEYEGQNCRFLF